MTAHGESDGKLPLSTLDLIPQKFWDECLSVWKKYDSSVERTLKSSRVISISKDLKRTKPYKNASREMISIVASCRFASRDITRTQLLLHHLEMSASNTLVPVPADAELIGMDNWLNVTCYLDCLVFVMFAKLTEYDDLLYHDPSSSADYNELRFLMRLVVNLLRSGELITTDIMQLLCHSLMTLGFPEAVSQKQQDPLMLFEFVTQALGLPLLTLKIDIIHSGQVNIDDDLKYMQERCLLIPLTEEEEEQMDPTSRQKPIALESCLNQYFNNSVTVKRHLQRRKTLQLDQTPDLDGGVVSDFDDLTETHNDVPGRILRRNTGSISKVNTIITSVRSRSSTMASSLFTDGNDSDKEVLLPAWMFLQLLPRYIDRSTAEREKKSIKAKFSSECEVNEEQSIPPQDDEHFNEFYFNRRPIIPIVLKRYMWDSESKPLKNQRKVDVPQTIDSPVFVEHESLFEGFKLTLQSFICHRGDSTESGHYIAAVPKTNSKTVPHDDTWLLFNDMESKASKVKEMSFDEILKNETPYILFYRIERAENEPRIKIVPPSGSKDCYWSENDSHSTLKKPPSEKPLCDMDQRRGSHSTAVSLANSLKQEKANSKYKKKLHRLGFKNNISRSTTKSGNGSTTDIDNNAPEKILEKRHHKSRECIIA